MTHPTRLIVIAALLAGCSSAPAGDAKPPPPPAGPLVKKVALADVGLDADAMDSSANPCEDFYQFACGGWLEHTTIPADRSRWSRSFSEIHKRNEADLRTILEQAAAGTPSDPGLKKLGDFYGSCMDENAVERAGLQPVSGYLMLAEKVRLRREPAFGPHPNQPPPPRLEDLLAELHRHRIWALFDIDSGQDFKDATHMIAQIDQNGLGLPDRDYYLDESERANELRLFYVGHVARMLGLAGYAEAKAAAAAAQIMALETEIAKISKSRIERRDPQGLYNKIDRAGLKERTRGFEWTRYLDAVGAQGVQDINVTSVPFVEGLGALLEKADKQALVHYLKWQILHRSAPALAKRFVDENFALQQKLTGQKELRPRWKRCVAMTDEALGELLAQPYVKKRFSAESKQGVSMMFAAISRAFSDGLAELSWMDETTRKRAAGKLGKMAYLIGYPDTWRRYDFPVKRSELGSNLLRAEAYETKRRLSKIGKPVDRGEWFMTPPTVNAYYDPNKNQMVFPAGILQPPFYNAAASLAVNLGGMGMVVGHELTHGFDDKGSQFDGDGNLKSWWQPKTRSEFDGRTACVDKQYSSFEAVKGVKLKGKLTLGENIADGGGVKLAYHAFRALRQGAQERLVADGFTEDQQFFLSMGQVWCSKVREAEARKRAVTDPHSPPRWRVNGTLQNNAAFAEAFACPEGSPMHPKNACSVW